MLAHASERTTNRESFKSYRKRFAQQTRRVDDFLSTVDSVLSKLPSTNVEAVDSLFDNTNDPYYKNHKVDTYGYNYALKYLDFYGAILDCNIHIMVIDVVPSKWIHQAIHGHQSLVPIYHSYVRVDKPHIYILRMSHDTTFSYHAISCIYTLMQNNFGYVDFCNKCHRCTYLKKDVHRYCGVVTPGMQYGSSYAFALQQNKNEWRPHSVNIQTAIDSVVANKFELSLDDYFERC